MASPLALILLNRLAGTTILDKIQQLRPKLESSQTQNYNSYNEPFILGYNHARIPQTLYIIHAVTALSHTRLDCQ